MLDSSLLSTFSPLLEHSYCTRVSTIKGRNGLYGDASAGGVLTSAIPVNSLASSSFGRLRYLGERNTARRREGDWKGMCVCVCVTNSTETPTHHILYHGKSCLRSIVCTLIILVSTCQDPPLLFRVKVRSMCDLCLLRSHGTAVLTFRRLRRLCSGSSSPQPPPYL